MADSPYYTTRTRTTFLENFHPTLLHRIFHNELSSSISVCREWTKVIDESIEEMELVLGGYLPDEPAPLTLACLRKIQEAKSMEDVEWINVHYGIRPMKVKDLTFLGHMCPTLESNAPGAVSFHVIALTKLVPAYEKTNTALFSIPYLRGLKITSPQVQEFPISGILEALQDQLTSAIFPHLTSLSVAVSLVNQSDQVLLTNALFPILLNHQETLTSVNVQLCGLSWNQNQLSESQVCSLDFDPSLLQLINLKSVSLSFGSSPFLNLHQGVLRLWLDFLESQVHGMLEEITFTGSIPEFRNEIPLDLLEANWASLTMLDFQFHCPIDPSTHRTLLPFSCTLLVNLVSLRVLRLKHQTESEGAELIQTSFLPRNLESISIRDLKVLSLDVEELVAVGRNQLRKVELVGVGGRERGYGMGTLTLAGLLERKGLDSLRLQNYSIAQVEEEYFKPVSDSDYDYTLLKKFYQVWIELETSGSYSFQTY